MSALIWLCEGVQLRKECNCKLFRLNFVDANESDNTFRQSEVKCAKEVLDALTNNSDQQGSECF